VKIEKNLSLYGQAGAEDPLTSRVKLVNTLGRLVRRPKPASGVTAEQIEDCPLLHASLHKVLS
jgi:hypothetical protein